MNTPSDNTRLGAFLRGVLTIVLCAVAWFVICLAGGGLLRLLGAGPLDDPNRDPNYPAR